MDRMTQIIRWVAGQAEHDDRDGHVPDYSCCRSELQAPQEQREMYLKAYLLDDLVTLKRMDLRFMRLMLGAKVTDDRNPL